VLSTFILLIFFKIIFANPQKIKQKGSAHLINFGAVIRTVLIPIRCM